MTNAIRFKDSLMYTAEHPITIAEAHRIYASYAGLLDVQFGNINENAFLKASNWLPFDSKVWTIDENGVVGSTGAGQFGRIFSDPGAQYGIYVPHSFAITFVVEGSGGMMYRVTDDQDEYFMVYWNALQITFYRVTNARTSPQNEVLVALPVGVSGTNEITIMCREYRYTSLDNDEWLLQAIWVNGSKKLAYASEVSQTRMGYGIGFEIAPNASVSWTDFFVPELNLPIDWATLDPGETPMSALQRVIGERNIKTFCRYDGSLMVWRPRSAPVVWIFTEKDLDVQKHTVDYRSVVTHVRLWGAFNESERIDTEASMVYGHRFKEVNNPNLFVEEDCWAEAQVIINRSKQMADTIVFDCPYVPIIEPEDRVRTPKGDYFVDSIQIDVEGHKVKMTINGRSYPYE